ncbi:MAG: hypothetical protein M1835_000952 [Candelina submexicana]|nr:MAG: hypothetical protein M1835_000952 [Candelina submexicana]
MGYSELPAEIREKILGYLLISPGHIVNPTFYRTGTNLVDPTILRVSQSTYKEGTHLLYHKNTFHFTRERDLSIWIYLRLDGPFQTNTMSHIIIQLAVPEYEVEDGEESDGTSQAMNACVYREWIKTLNNIRTAGPDLETLVLWFKACSTNETVFEDPEKWARVILQGPVRNLQRLEVWGILPDGFDDELLDALKPMLKSP